MASSTQTPETSVWYFVGATFIFSSPALFFRDSALPWLPFVTYGLGLVVFVTGIVVFVREQRQRRSADNTESPGPPEPPTPA